MTHYFDSPDGEGKRYRFEVDVWGRRLSVHGSDGIFSGRGLDKATAVLLRETWPSPQARTVLDLGCGWGPLTLALAHELPHAHVWAVDVNDRALAVCRDNVEQTGVASRVTVCRPDDVDPDQTFDEIWSNPPIRIGKGPLHELLQRWLVRLNPWGVAWFVVGKNLGSDSLQTWLQTQGYACDKQASAKGFRVLRVHHLNEPR